jgi:hypothetical protein
MRDSRLDEERLVHQLVSLVPEFSPVLKEHLDFNHELLPHVLFGDITRWVIDRYREARGHTGSSHGQDEILDRTLGFLERKFSDPEDSAAHDLIAVSFLENLHQAGPDYEGLKRRLGPNLRSWLSRLE